MPKITPKKPLQICCIPPQKTNKNYCQNRFFLPYLPLGVRAILSFLNPLFRFLKPPSFFPLLLLITLTHCAPSTLEDLRCQGEAEMRKLTEELRKIQSNEDAQKYAPRIKKRFNNIAALLIESRKFTNPNTDPLLAGEELFAEFARVYEIPGTRETLEAAQSEAIRTMSKLPYTNSRK